MSCNVKAKKTAGPFCSKNPQSILFLDRYRPFPRSSMGQKSKPTRPQISVIRPKQITFIGSLWPTRRNRSDYWLVPLSCGIFAQLIDRNDHRDFDAIVMTFGKDDDDSSSTTLIVIRSKD